MLDIPLKLDKYFTERIQIQFVFLVYKAYIFCIKFQSNILNLIRILYLLKNFTEQISISYGILNI